VIFAELVGDYGRRLRESLREALPEYRALHNDVARLTQQ
jgi:hypothetical protein